MTTEPVRDNQSPVDDGAAEPAASSEPASSEAAASETPASETPASETPSSETPSSETPASEAAKEEAAGPEPAAEPKTPSSEAPTSPAQGAEVAGVGAPSTGAVTAAHTDDPTQHEHAHEHELELALAEAQAERDAAVTALDKKGRRSRRRARERRIVVVVLVVLFSILLPITFVVTWAHYTALNTNGFVNTLGPVATNPAVTAAVSAEVTDQVYDALNPEQILKSALPQRVQFLAGPISNGAKTYVQSGVNTVLQSSQFQTLFTQALRFAHSELVSALNGNGNAVKTTNGQVVLDLVPLLNNVLQDLQGYITGVVGHSVTLPTITANEVPATACKQISQALNRPLPSTCGQIVLFPADKLNEARHLVRIFNRITILLLILTPVLAALALWISRRRRRTLLQLCVGGVIGLVVIRRAVHWLGTTLANTGNPANKAARQAIVTQLFHIYYDVSTWILIVLVVVFAIALVTGPYAWAVSFRRVAEHWLRAGWNLVVAVAGHARDDATFEWVRSHLDLLRVLGVVLALVLLLALSVSWIGFLIIAVLLIAYEYWLYRIGQAARALDPSVPPDDSTPPPDQPASPTGDAGVVQPH